MKILKTLSILALLTAAFSNTAQAAPIYIYENTPSPDKIMDTYSTIWNPNNEVLSISSSWDASANIDRIAFLISDGGSPYLTPTEQFLWYDLDLNTSVLTVSNYFDTRLTLETFDASTGVNVTSDSIELNINHSSLNSLTFTGFDYSGAGFSDDIGIWYYMYSNGTRVETLDIHHGTPSTVPVPAAIWLFASGLIGLVGVSRRKAA
jgi:hypothetical protein